MGSAPPGTIQTSQLRVLPLFFPTLSLLTRKDFLQLEFLAPCVFRGHAAVFSQTSAILYTQDICFAFPTLCLAVAYFKIVPEMCLLSYLVFCQCPSCEIVHPCAVLQSHRRGTCLIRLKLHQVTLRGWSEKGPGGPELEILHDRCPQGAEWMSVGSKNSAVEPLRLHSGPFYYYILPVTPPTPATLPHHHGIAVLCLRRRPWILLLKLPTPFLSKGLR